MKINGLESVIDSLDAFGKAADQVIRDNVEVSGYQMQAEAMRRVPVDLGQLKNSIKFVISDEGKTVELIATAPYAPFQEFGTGGLVSIPPGMEELAAVHRGFGLRQVNIRPQPFMHPAWDKESKAFVIRLNKELQRLVDQQGPRGNWFKRTFRKLFGS